MFKFRGHELSKVCIYTRPGSSDKPHFFSLERSLCAVSYSQLTQNAAHVILDSPLRQVEILGDLAI